MRLSETATLQWWWQTIIQSAPRSCTHQMESSWACLEWIWCGSPLRYFTCLVKSGPHWRNTLLGFSLHFSTSAFTTGWINHHVGIAMGCMILPILFIMAMQIILDMASSHTLGPSLNKEVTLTAFMNDTMILTPDVSYAEDMLAHLDKLISWCRMRFKPKKFRTCPSLRARWQQRHSPSQGRPSLRWWTHLVNSLSRVYNKKMQ